MLVTKNLKNIALSLLVMALMVSCSSTMWRFRINDWKTERVFSRLAKKHGNAFYVNTTYSNYSRVWYYSDGRMVVHMLVNGKTRSKKDYPSKTQLTYTDSANYELLYSGCMELDGDFISFKLVSNDTIIEKSSSVNIDCFKNGKYESKFLNDIAQDIITYEMW